MEGLLLSLNIISSRCGEAERIDASFLLALDLEIMINWILWSYALSIKVYNKNVVVNRQICSGLNVKGNEGEINKDINDPAFSFGHSSH